MRCAIFYLLGFCAFEAFFADANAIDYDPNGLGALIEPIPVHFAIHKSSRCIELYAVNTKFDKDISAEIKVTDPSAKNFAVWDSAKVCVNNANNKMRARLMSAQGQCDQSYKEDLKKKSFEDWKKCCKEAADTLAKKVKSDFPVAKACIERCVKGGSCDAEETVL